MNFFTNFTENWVESILIITVITLQVIAAAIAFMKNNRIRTFVSKSLDLSYDDSIHVESMESKDFNELVTETNKYLKSGNSEASFLLRMCEEKIEALQTGASSLTNIPLYLGLCGTFIGIIAGLSGLDLSKLFVDADNIMAISKQTQPISNLLWYVGVAMSASLLGLILMICNTLLYRYSCQKYDENVNIYHAFIRDKVASKQLSLVETADKINQTFKTLENSSTALNNFYNYQRSLNDTALEVKNTMAALTGFITKLDNLSNYQTTTNNLIQEFRTAMEKNFPTGSDARKELRKAYDNLSADAQNVSKSLQLELSNISTYITSFVNANKQIFESADMFRQYIQTQKDSYDNLTSEMNSLKTSVDKLAETNAEKDKDIVVALKAMTEALAELKNKQ